MLVLLLILVLVLLDTADRGPAGNDLGAAAGIGAVARGAAADLGVADRGNDLTADLAAGIGAAGLGGDADAGRRGDIVLDTGAGTDIDVDADLDLDSVIFNDDCTLRGCMLGLAHYGAAYWGKIERAKNED